MDKKETSVWWAVLGLFFPIIGLVLFLIWHKSEPQRADYILKGSLVSFVVSFTSYLLYNIL